MADIQNDINQIATARYGREVRGSIVNALTLMNEESSEAIDKAVTAQDSASASAESARQSAESVIADMQKVNKLRGGTQGQILAKNSNADYDYEWQDNQGGGQSSDAYDIEYGTSDVGSTLDSINTHFNDVDASISQINTDIGQINNDLSELKTEILYNDNNWCVAKTDKQVTINLYGVSSCQYFHGITLPKQYLPISNYAYNIVIFNYISGGSTYRYYGYIYVSPNGEIGFTHLKDESTTVANYSNRNDIQPFGSITYICK